MKVTSTHYGRKDAGKIGYYIVVDNNGDHSIIRAKTLAEAKEIAAKLEKKGVL